MKLPVSPPIEPMLAKAVGRIHPGWHYEPKWDGFRAIVFRDKDELDITSRNSRPLARYFPEVVSAIKETMPSRCVVDGEIIIANPERGGLDFWALQQRLHPAQSRIQLLAGETPADFVAFDVLAVGDEDLMLRPFRDRRRVLEQLLLGDSASVHVTPLTDEAAIAQRWFEDFEGAGLDGIIAKNGEDTYQPGRRVMEKVKHDRTMDCVVAGYRVHKSGPGAVGSLLLGLYSDENAPGVDWAEMFGGLTPIGVAASFPMEMRSRLVTDLDELVIAMSEHPWGNAVEEISSEGRVNPGSRWNPGKDLSFVPLRPERVAEVRYNHMDGGRLRHPAQFLRWRPDRDPASCGFDQLERPDAVDVAEILAQATTK